MTINTSASLDSARLALCNSAVNSVLKSGRQHAAALLRDDLFVNGYDSFSDEWYVKSTSSNKFSKWFYLPGPIRGTRCRYRFYIEDIKPSKEHPDDYQPLLPVAWSDGKWVPTDDINAVSKSDLKGLIKRFDNSSTNELKLNRVTAELADDRDSNNYLSDINVPDTEAITFDIIADKTDTRWIHFDDTMRLGRYYEQRASHNFFLIKDAELFYNNDTGKTNAAVKLDNKPMSHLPGWSEYSKMRNEAGLPMWYPGMWNNLVAITGAGRNLKKQNVISNTIDTLFFEDDNYNRFMPTGIFRQTVTFVGWFSSLNELQAFKTRAARDRGSIFTLTNSAPDGLLITNVNPETDYRMTLYTGNPLPEKLNASASFFGMDSLQEIEFSKDGVAVFNKGRPATSHAYRRGNYLELIIRSPEEGISKDRPFFIDSAILEQPEFITFHNNSKDAINLRSWRLGYKCGGLIFYSSPFGTSSYYSVKSAERVENPSPVIPPNSSLILTDDLPIFDRFSGANKNGIWGDNAGENVPAIQVSSWAPEFKIESIKSIKTYSQKSTANKKHPWETDWEIKIDGVNWSDKISNLKNEVVLFDADGKNEKFSPVPGVIVGQNEHSLIIRFAGSGKRFKINKDSILRFAGLSDIISEYYLLNSEGKIAALLHKPQKVKRKDKAIMFKRLFSGKLESEEINWRTVARQIGIQKSDYRLINNNTYESPIKKSEILDALRITISNDWYLCNSRFLKFSDAQSQPINNIRIIKDKVKIKRIEGSKIIFDGGSPGFPIGLPGIFASKLFIKNMVPLSIQSFSDSSCELLLPNNFAAMQTVNKAAVISPDGASGGIHIFGVPGDIIYQWTNLPKISSAVKLTLAGYGIRAPFFPKTTFERNVLTNRTLELSISIWDKDKIKYVSLISKRSFDSSGRIFLGKVPGKFLKSGQLRVKITTHNILTPGKSSLWLRGIYIHPFTEEKYININTVPNNKLIYVCGNKTNLAVILAKKLRAKKYFRTAGEMYRLIKKNKLSISGAEKFIIRSEIFRAEIEAEIINEETGKIISRKAGEKTINRSLFP
ncbi:MAG: hypothetical protein DRI44_05030 [Chlamydiae bacterium]|nr:MAG: hypothetical protein DRI44_05030 [Chlamydiota bacterium]